MPLDFLSDEMFEFFTSVGTCRKIDTVRITKDLADQDRSVLAVISDSFRR